VALSTVGLAAVVVVAATVAALAGPQEVTGSAAVPVTSPSSESPSSASPSSGGAPVIPEVAAVFPTVLRIPAIGVTTELVRLNLDATGALAAPEDFGRAGWFAAGTVPGDQGPAVLAGHVDSRDGPAVFFRLRELHEGDEVQVDRSDGRTVSFRVVSVRSYPKDRFPTAEVYGPTPVPELHLVTCGGPFDRAGGRYLDNIVVQAVPLPF
jgi:sortase (surface protein transpeptidase)